LSSFFAAKTSLFSMTFCTGNTNTNIYNLHYIMNNNFVKHWISGTEILG